MSALTRNTVAAVVLLAGLMVAGPALTAGTQAATSAAVPPASGGLSCKIQSIPANGGISLVGVVDADVAVSGSYAFHVASSGGGNSADIDQGGPFSAGAKGTVAVGTVTLAAGADYTATLTLTVNGATVACTGKPRGV
jgi:hypothetical protein